MFGAVVPAPPVVAGVAGACGAAGELPGVPVAVPPGVVVGVLVPEGPLAVPVVGGALVPGVPVPVPVPGEVVGGLVPGVVGVVVGGSGALGSTTGSSSDTSSGAAAPPLLTVGAGVGSVVTGVTVAGVTGPAWASTTVVALLSATPLAAGADCVTRGIFAIVPGTDAIGLLLSTRTTAAWRIGWWGVVNVRLTSTAPPAPTTAAATTAATWLAVTPPPTAAPQLTAAAPPAAALAPPPAAAVPAAAPPPPPMPSSFASSATGPSAGVSAANRSRIVFSSLRYARQPAQSCRWRRVSPLARTPRSCASISCSRIWTQAVSRASAACASPMRERTSSDLTAGTVTSSAAARST